MNATNMDSLSEVNTEHRYSHVVQFYSEDRFRLDELTNFIGTALAARQSAVVIATQGHEESLSQKLKNQGLDLASAIAEGRYIALETAETLSKFMADGIPDPVRFSEVIGAVIARAAAAAQDENHRVVAFGEMVALLWAEGKPEAAVQVEKLWNQMARTYSFSLRCAYPMQGFYREEHTDPLLQIRAEHTGVVPDESYSELTSEEERLRSVVRLQQQMQVLRTEVESHQRDEQFRLFVEAVPDYAILMLDREGHVSTWNTGAERIKGYKASEIKGKHFSCFYPAEDVRSGKPQRLIELAVREGHSGDEGWRLRKDGSKFWASVTITAVRERSGNLIGFGKVTRDLTEHRRAVLALRRSEDRFRVMAEAVQDYAIFMLDPEGHVSTWNGGAERVTGYHASEIIGKHFACFYPEEDIQSGKPVRELAVAAQEGRLEDDGRQRRKDGSIFWANVIITPIRDDTKKLIGFAKVTRDVTERMQKEKSLRDLTSHLLQMQDEERRRIGRDLHDSLGQCVTAMKISLDCLAASPEVSQTALSQKVNQCVRLAEECVKEVRTFSYLLYPPMLEEMGLKCAVRWYLEGFTTRSGIQVTFETSNDFGRFSRDTELALFRVLQESLTNVHRHSGSQTAQVRLSTNEERAVLEIRDNGKGIPSATPEESAASWRGVGLRGMKERLGQLGGQLDISSSEHGTTVTATLPVPEFSAARS